MADSDVRLLILSGLTGAAIQHYFEYVTGFPGYVWRRIRSQTALVGTWYSYHYSRQHSQPLLQTVTWSIRRNYRGRYAASCQYDGAHALRGTGFVSRERGFLVLQMSASTYEAEWAIRTLDPIPTSEEVVPGLWLSYDFDGELTAGPMILCRVRIDETDAKQLLRSRTSVLAASRLLGVRRTMRQASLGQQGSISPMPQP